MRRDWFQRDELRVGVWYSFFGLMFILLKHWISTQSVTLIFHNGSSFKNIQLLILYSTVPTDHLEVRFNWTRTVWRLGEKESILFETLFLLNKG